VSRPAASRADRAPFRLLAISQLATLPGAGGRGEAALAWFAALAAAGVDALQLREKHLDDLGQCQLARSARAAFPPPAALLVNGRADIALAAGADGVHLPADGVPAGAVRARFGSGLLIGVSTHRLEEVERARRDGADYVVFGPVYPTPAKAGHGAPAGTRVLARAAALGIPVYALGGVTLERFAEVAAAGAAGVAGIRLFQGLPESRACTATSRAFDGGDAGDRMAKEEHLGAGARIGALERIVAASRACFS
jgi:thiamine-phosphate pyrophosphorylase